jgi:hypothetical protein
VQTLLEACGVRVESGAAFDGTSVLRVLRGLDAPRDRTLFWRYNANVSVLCRVC